MLTYLAVRADGVPDTCMALSDVIGRCRKYPQLRPKSVGKNALQWDGVTKEECDWIISYFTGKPMPGLPPS